jgi:hypothetical protein
LIFKIAQSDFHLPVRPTRVVGKNRQFFTGTPTGLATRSASLGPQLQNFDNTTTPSFFTHREQGVTTGKLGFQKYQI